jgi:hypothetical protein
MMKTFLSLGLLLLTLTQTQSTTSQKPTQAKAVKSILDSGVPTETLSSSTPSKDSASSPQTLKVTTEHPLMKTVNKTNQQPSQLDLSIKKFLEAEKEKSAMIKQNHIDVDPNTDDIEEENRIKEEGEKKKLKMFLYQRRKFEMNQELLIDLNFGFDLDKKVSGQVLSFHPDLAYDKVLVQMAKAECLEENQCTKPEDGKREEGDYNAKSYSYFNGLSFLGVQRIRPGELSRDDEHNLDHFFTLPMRFYDDAQEFNQNILGLGPNSDVWSYWSSIYNFPSGFINLTLCYYKHHEYILFDSKIDFDNEIILKVPKNSNMYMFKGSMDFDDKELNLKDGDFKFQELNLCLGNEPGLTMKVVPSIMDLIKKSLCETPDRCSMASDLKKDSDMELSLKFTDFQKEKSFFKAKFFKNSFVEKAGEDLNWKVELIKDLKNNEKCDIILHQEFLKEKYLMISYDLKDPDSLYIGFKIMRESDFSKFDFYFYSILLFLILTITMMVLFIILNYKINRFIEKEEKEKEKLLQES